MAVDAGVTSPATAEGATADLTAVYVEGLRAGLVGAAVIALWFLVLDTLQGRPFYTPHVLGTALMHAGRAWAPGETSRVDFETVVSFTWVHVLAFLLIGVAAARLLAVAERYPNFGFGILLLFVVVQCTFVGACVLFAEPVLHALAWPAVLVGNLLAAGAMAVVFWRGHPRLAIRP